MLNRFCKELYSKGKGNAEIPTKSGTMARVDFGKNELGIDMALVRFLEARKKTKDRLPTDFKACLEKNGYFSSIDTLLKTDLRKKSRTAEGVFGRNSSKLSLLLAECQESVLIDRIEKSGIHGYNKWRLSLRNFFKIEKVIFPKKSHRPLGGESRMEKCFNSV
jgi:hypothetical protein